MTTVDLSTITLDKGSHDSPAAGLCLLEAVAYFAGEPHSDHPRCASEVLTNFGININDRFPHDKRQKLVPLIPQIVGTRDDGQDEARGYLALDWLIRTHTPAWLDLAGLTIEAQELRDLRRIVDLAAAQEAGPVVRRGRDKAAAARYAARAAADAAVAAARYAARYAAADAAVAATWYAAADAAADAAVAATRYAAADAAGAAGRYAAVDATWYAAADAAGAAGLASTVSALQDSALDLFTRMIHPEES